MLFERLTADERMRASAGRIGMIWLGVTQVLLAAVIFYRLYALGQPDHELRDFQAVLALSLFGHIALQLYFGGLFPVPTRSGMAVMYLGLVGLIAGVCLIVHGVPPLAEWHSTYLPAVVGPALLVGLYWFVACLGKRRVEQLMEIDD